MHTLSSFFESFPTEGCFECNPPFDAESVCATYVHIHAVIERATKRHAAKHRGEGSSAPPPPPLLFIIVTPFVSLSPAPTRMFPQLRDLLPAL